MARWKARVEFLLSVIELVFLSLTVEALQGKRCQDSLLSKGGRTCTVLHTVVLTQYRRVTDRQTDGQTDGIAVASTALAVRALHCAVNE